MSNYVVEEGGREIERRRERERERERSTSQLLSRERERERERERSASQLLSWLILFSNYVVGEGRREKERGGRGREGERERKWNGAGE